MNAPYKIFAAAMCSLLVGFAAAQAYAHDDYCPTGNIYLSTLAERNQKTAEVSTAELRRILLDGSAIVVDVRRRAEYAAGHIPSARNVPWPGVAPAEVVAAFERLVGGDKSKALVLYCNGPFCKMSKKTGKRLATAGFTNVRRYQLGIPIWRSLGGPTEIELKGIIRIYNVDRTAVFFDARPAEEFAKGSLPGAHNIPPDKLARNELLKASLPRHDFNTRIVLFGRDFGQARKLADAMSTLPWHNVTYFPGTFATLRNAIE